MKTHARNLMLRVFLTLLTTLGFSTFAQTTNVWTDNFESPNVWDNWSVDNGVWEIGAPATGPATNSLGYRTHEGTNCAATVLAGNYPGGTTSRLIRNIFVVPSAVQNPRLQFWHWYQFSGNSYGVVQVRIGATGTWTNVSPLYYATGSGVWTRPVVDLSAYAGKAIQVAFTIVADGNVADGWDVDEVRFIKGPIQTLTPNLAESFEQGLGDWYAETGTWEVGVPTYGPNTAHSGTNCLATVLGGNYEDDRSSRFVSPSFVVPSADQLPRLRFWEWFNIGANDYVQVQIKVGTNAWQALASQITLDSFDRWTRAQLDLTAYAGQTVQIGFYFESHGHQEGCPWCYEVFDPGPGWYVDDVLIETGPLPSLALPEGFETGWGGWQVDYIGGRVTDFGIWEIGKPTYGPATNASGLRAHSGTNCAATVLNGDYPDDRSARLVSPAFVVPQVGAHPKLQFWHWFNIAGHDFCEIQIKTASGGWQPLTRYNPANSAVWSQVPPFDLSQYAGQTVQIGFYFESHGYLAGCPWCYEVFDPGPGWYVDDIAVTSVTPPTGIVEFTDARYFVNEGGGSATISVERKYGSAGAVDVTYVASDGTAAGGADFDSVADTLSWADGEQGVKTFTVPITQDALVEGNETVILDLIVPGALVSSVAREQATLVIVDDDGTLPMSTNIAYLRSLVVTTNYVATNTTSLFTVDGTVSTYANLGTGADEMFFMQDNTNGLAVLFRGGTNQFMPQAGDRLRVTATLTNINGLLALAPNYANITNVVWRLSVSNSLPTPGALDFAARTSVPDMEALEARYVSVSQVMIDQTGGSTFPTVLTNLVVTNQSGQTFSLTIHPNTDIGGQVKPTGSVTILGVLTQNDPTSPYTTNYSLLPTRYADIVGGDPGMVQFTATNFVVLESGPAVTLSATRTSSSNGPVTVSFGTVNGTATAGADFVATNGVLAWADGEGGEKTFTVQILNDAAEEPDELFTVGLSGAALGSNTTAQIMIVNDDFVLHPASQSVILTSNAVFTITSTPSTVGFDWWKDGVAKGSGSVGSLTVANVQTNDAGNYWAVVTTTAGSVTSSVAALTVLVPPGITGLTMQPASPVLEGTNVTFSVTATGTPTLAYTWRRNGSVLPGGTLNSFTITNVQIANAGAYSVAISNAAGGLISGDLTLAVLPDWRTNTVGSTGDGSYSINNGIFTVNGSGEDIEGTKDDFFFVHKPLLNDGQIVARMLGMVPADPRSEAGIMLRDGTNSGARHVFLALDSSRHVLLRRRLFENDYSLQNAAQGTNWAWLRLSRMGDTFVGHASTNGGDWSLIWWTTLANMPTNIEVGLAVTAHRNQAIATAQFDSVLTGGLTPIPGTWLESGPRILLGGEPTGYPSLQYLGGFKMLFQGAVGEQYDLKFTTNMAVPFASWDSLGFITNQIGVLPFLDRQALTNQPRYYRLIKTGP